ncbi:MAG TPA: hypothetical protein VM694_34170, partial [Polyangium sp.]|nr:hypothetical protein [Polyangium sp.]
MRPPRRSSAAFGLFAALLAAPAAAVAAPAGSSAVALDRGSLVAYVADADNEALHRVDLVSGSVATTPLGCAPAEVLVLAEDRVAVSLRGCNEVQVLDLDAAGEGTVAARAVVPAEPWGLARGPRGALLVTSAYGRALTALDGESLAERFSLRLPREAPGFGRDDRARGDRALAGGVEVEDL